MEINPTATANELQIKNTNAPLRLSSIITPIISHLSVTMET